MSDGAEVQVWLSIGEGVVEADANPEGWIHLHPNGQDGIEITIFLRDHTEEEIKGTLASLDVVIDGFQQAKAHAVRKLMRLTNGSDPGQGEEE